VRWLWIWIEWTCKERTLVYWKVHSNILVLFLFGNVIYVFLLLWLCNLIVCLCLTTLIKVFPCFFLSCKANARVKHEKTGHSPHSSSFLCCSMYFCVVLCIVCFVSFSVLFVCICVLNYCHRVATQLQLSISYHTTNHTISYHIISYHIISYHII
jgi:hypothetical protein